MLFETEPGLSKPRPQSIVITGESGAGKTYTTKNMLNFLAVVGEDPHATGDTGPSAPELMLGATPILEGWGNANMPRNPDSSRFGKLYQIYFNREKRFITGCNVNPYMLEKSRIASQQMYERNFHIFYRMMAGPVWKQKQKDKWSAKGRDVPSYDKSSLMLPRKESAEFGDFIYLDGGVDQLRNNPNYERIYTDVPKGWRPEAAMKEGIPEARDYMDGENMAETMEALELFFGDHPGGVETILNVTAGVLHIGNITFDKKSESTCEVNTEGKSGQALDAVARLWGVNKKALSEACNCVFLKSVGLVSRSVASAVKLRDAMAKSVYDELFKWMVATFSKKLQADPRLNTNDDNWIGVLDIFGFEFYEEAKLTPETGAVLNSLDQFNINYCNEKLQGVFVECVFTLERALYEDQIGDPIISLETLGKIDNSDTLNYLADAKGRGANSVVEQLDNVCNQRGNEDKYPNGEDQDDKFFQNLQKFMKKKDVATRLRPAETKGRHRYKCGKMQGGFYVEHYAAHVLYDIRGWYSKENDKLSDPILDCLTASTDDFFMSGIYDKKQNSSKSKDKATVCGDFKAKLDALVLTLGYTDTNFVRCIKASNPLCAGQFTAGLVLNQLRYTGMLDTLKIRRLGFPFRQSHRKFWNEYHVLEPASQLDDVDTLVNTIKGWTRDLAEKVMAKTGSDIPSNQVEDAIRVGHSKRKTGDLILVREWLSRELDTMRNEALATRAVLIQSVYRACEYTKEYKALSEAAFAIAPHFRGVMARLDYYQDKWKYLEKKARTGLVLNVRCGLARKVYYNERQKLFRAQLMRQGQELLYATLQRQMYYEQKQVYIAHEVQKVEVWSMARQDAFSRKYNRDLESQLMMQSEESHYMELEDEYVKKVAHGKEMEVFILGKEKEMKEAKEFYDRACESIKPHRQHDAEHKWREKALGDQAAVVEQETIRRCRDMMIRMHIIQDVGPLALPKLMPLPAGEEGGPPNPKARFEQQRYHNMVVKNTMPGEVVESIGKVQNILRTTEEQKALIVKIAGLVDANPQELFALLGCKVSGGKR